MARLIIILSGGSGTHFLVICGVILAVVFGIYLMNYNWRRTQVKNVFKRYPFTDIDKVKDGEYVKIKGVIWDGGEKIISPLSERSCVYYHIHAEECVGGKNKHWVTLFDEEVMSDVVLKSGNHFAVIEADSPLAHLMFDKVYTSGFLKDTSPKMEKYLRKFGHDVTNGIGLNRRIEIKEAVLRRGEEFAVAGRARWISADELKFKIPVQKVLLIAETKNDYLFLTEDPHLVKEELFKGNR